MTNVGIPQLLHRVPALSDILSEEDFSHKADLLLGGRVLSDPPHRR